jgi:Helix-turn-helix domain
MPRPPPAAPLYDGLNESASLSLHLMLEEGLSIADIPARRGLKESTVYGHCADALALGMVEPQAVIPLSLEEPASIAALHEQRASGAPRLQAVFERFEGR